MAPRKHEGVVWFYKNSVRKTNAAGAEASPKWSRQLKGFKKLFLVCEQEQGLG